MACCQHFMSSQNSLGDGEALDHKFLPASAHAAENDEPGVGAVLVGVGARRVRLPRRRRRAVAGGHVPVHHRRVGAQLQSVKVLQVAGNIVLGILGVVGKTAEEVNLRSCEIEMDKFYCSQLIFVPGDDNKREPDMD